MNPQKRHQFPDDSEGNGGTKEKLEQKDLYFKEEKWNFIKERPFAHSKVYRSADDSKYLRIGDIENIKAEATYIKNLYQLKFPVPEVLEQGELNGYGYYIEGSIGQTSFRDKFRDECASQGKVNSDTLKSFCNTACIFLNAQIKSSGHHGRSDLRKKIMLLNVLEENPDLDTNRVENCIQKIERKLFALPEAFTHGDLTPRNMFENGVIDFEFSFIASIGYDVLTAPLVERFWGFKNYDRKTYEEFFLNEEQITYYFNRIEVEARRHGIKDFLSFRDDFVLLKAVWSLAYEKHHAELSEDMSKWNFRKQILAYCMDCYLNGEPINTMEFKKLNAT